jgi:hypothetical protein
MMNYIDECIDDYIDTNIVNVSGKVWKKLDI